MPDTNALESMDRERERSGHSKEGEAALGKGHSNSDGKEEGEGVRPCRRWQGVSSQQRELQGQKLLGGSQSSVEAHGPEGE